jgi:hypothetical protein
MIIRGACDVRSAETLDIHTIINLCVVCLKIAIPFHRLLLSEVGNI